MQPRLSPGVALSLVVLGLLGCGGEPPTDELARAGRVAIEVAPLSLAGVTDARYTLTVTSGPDGTGETVWQRTVTSSQYGDGAGSLAYVGPCDASAAQGSVSLELLTLYGSGGAPIDEGTWVNPTPITRNVVCVQNADVPVTFDMTIVRDAQQGFFDVAVSFDDIFCSAKLDCVRDGGDEDLELLHNPLEGGARDLTAVLAFACTADPDGDETFLYMDDVRIVCDGLSADVKVDVSGIGNVDLAAAPNANTGGYLFGASVYRGEEALAAKAYWTVSLGLNDGAFPLARDCTLVSRATASAESWPLGPDGGFSPPDGTVYPVIAWNVPLTDADGRVCGAHEVGGGDEVAVTYEGYLPALNLFGWLPTRTRMDNRFDPKTGELRKGNVPACDDALMNGDESDVDCGGSCGGCGDGEGCGIGADCLSGVCAGALCQAAGCSDGVVNQDETDVDCGGSCGGCDDGEGCAIGADCLSGVCAGALCQAAGCSDGVVNQDETDVDCGGASCGACADGEVCAVGGDCLSGVCTGALCQAAGCSDGVVNQDETDVDCGGATCGACADGEVCGVGGDCLSGVCTGALCQAAGCSDWVVNQDETDVDCGGATCGACADGDVCGVGGDCLSGVCTGALCQAAGCSDGVVNQDETDVDCGGATCGACADGDVCGVGGDCLSGVCTGTICQAASCSDGVVNQDETDVDCGGASCGACADGDACFTDGDCVSARCVGAVCQAGTCSDGALNQDETGVDCGGVCDACDGEGCAGDADCVSGWCDGGTCATPTCDDDLQNGAETGVDCGGSCDPCCGALGVACPTAAGFACTANGTCENAATNEVWVPAGGFWMGCSPAEQAADECNTVNTSYYDAPFHYVTTDAYAIDRTEVTAAAYRAWCEAVPPPAVDFFDSPFDRGCTPAAVGQYHDTYDPQYGRQDHPIVGVGWYQARQYCLDRGATLCTEQEWEKAARGGCETVTGDCHDNTRSFPWDAGDGSPRTPPSGCDQAIWADCTPLDDGTLFVGFKLYIHGGRFTHVADSMPAGASPYGALHMAGNANEWTDSWWISYPGQPYAFDDSTSDGRDHCASHFVRRGGHYNAPSASLRASRRDTSTPGNYADSYGFRCCRAVD